MRLKKRTQFPDAISTTILATEADNDDITTGKFACMVCGMNFDNVDFDKVQKHYRENHIQRKKLWKRVDEGVIAFGEWLTTRDNSNNNELVSSPLSVMKYQENVQVLILDKELAQVVNVDINTFVV